MTSSAAVVYVRPTIRGPRGGRGVVLATHRQVAGLYTTSLTRSVSKKNWRPHGGVSIGDVVDQNGNPTGQSVKVNPDWMRHFADLGQRKLGGATFPTVPDITEIFQLSQSNATAISQIQTALEQMVNANAQSLAALLQVVQTAALAGAAQIPPVVLARQETNIPPAPDPLGGAGGGGGD